MQEWQREVVMVDPRVLVPHPRRDEGGARYDTDTGVVEDLPQNMAALMLDLLESGIKVPLIVQEGTNILVTGHFRRAVAIESDWMEVPVRYVDVNDADAYALMLKDNWVRNDAINNDRMAVAKNIQLVAEKYLEEMGEENSGVRIQLNGMKGNISYKKVIPKVRKIFNIGKTTMYDYLSLLKLIPELQKVVSEDRIGMEAAVSLSKLDADVQKEFYRRHQNEERITSKMVDLFLTRWETSLGSAHVQIQDMNPLAYSLSPSDSMDEQEEGELTEAEESDEIEEEEDEEEWEMPDSSVLSKAHEVIQPEEEKFTDHVKWKAIQNLDSELSSSEAEVKQFEMAVSRTLQLAERQYQEIKKAWTSHVISHYSEPQEIGFARNFHVLELGRRVGKLDNLMKAILELQPYTEVEE